MKLPRLAGGVNRVPAGGDFATAGVKPAFEISCQCTGRGRSLSCTCSWRSGGCSGSSTSRADGSWEAHHGCDAASPK